MIVVTGATGQLGRLAISNLIDRQVPAEQIIAVVRDPGRAADLAARGVRVRAADYGEPETLNAAFDGARKLLFISGSEVGRRIAQHRNVVGAAIAAGIGLVAYTSIPHADTARLKLAQEHLATENMIRESGLPFVFLRNGWYFENYTAGIAATLEHGVQLGASGDGRIAAAARADYAEAAAAVLTADGPANAVYELTGDTSFTMAEYAAELSEQSGKPVAYQNLPADEYAAALTGFGVPPAMAGILADSDQGVARGELDVAGDDLRRLIGRPTTPLSEAIAEALRSS